jgi:hypothetical protein
MRLIALILILTILFTACTQSKYISVRKLQPPEQYIDLTDKLEQYPELKAVKFAKPDIELNVSLKEFFELEDELKGVDYIKVDEEFYNIILYKAVGLRRVSHTPSYAISEGLEIFREMLEFGKLRDYEEIRKTNRQITVVGGGFELYDVVKWKIIRSDIVIFEDGVVRSNITREEIYQVKKFIEENGSIIRLEGEYYQVFVESSIHLAKIEYPPRCVEISKEELEEYPVLKRAIDVANKSGRATLSVPPEEWRKIIEFVDWKCIEVKGSYYEVNFMTT